MSTFNRVTRVIMIGAAIGILSGCASMNERIDQAMSTAQQAQRDAAAAKTAADSANRAASDAKASASSASSAAKAAQRAADQANACCAANSDKIERMFRDAMKK